MAATTAVLLPALALASAPAAAFAAPTDGILASGDDWSVETAPGGYLVTYELEEPLPIVDDAPTLVVDGVTVGLASESPDGLSLTLLTSDAKVADARAVEKGWASSEDEKAAEDPAPAPTVEETNEDLTQQLRRMAPLAATEDPGSLGAYAVTEAEYDFGDRAVALAGIGGIRGEMTGKMYLSSAAGERPTVVLLHGRHGSCSSVTGLVNALRWPCIGAQVNVRSYQGYEGTGRALASHGYNVLSIGANAVNSNDNQLALDYGAQARGQLVLDTLEMLEKANTGAAVAFEDISWPGADSATTTTVRTLDQALGYATTRTDAPAAAGGVTAASLVGRFDLDNVGLMGHSRGGEGVVSAATLNQGLEDPYGIVSVLPLAPVDFGRMTLPDVPTGVFLPYCDGDVSNQQGQHLIDDARHAFGDEVLRSAVWIMGANHNFFNTVWTPGLYPYSTSDDWNTRDTTSSCATNDPTRLTASQQYQVGVSYMSGFFRLTMGGETQFQSLFDGSVKPATTATPFADVRVMAAQPSGSTTLVTDFAASSTLVRTSGNASAQVCANAETATSIAPSVPYCTTREVGTSRVPHWTPVRFGLNVPAYPVTRLTWTGSTSAPAQPSTGELRVSVPEDRRDVSARTQLTVKAAPIVPVTSGTDFTLTVIDGAGNTFQRAASEINPLAVNRMPGGTNATLNKIVLQQLTVPTSEMTGIDLTDVREVRFTAGVGADGTGAGGVFLSDLAFDTPNLGKAAVQTRTTIDVATTIVEEGDAPDTAEVAVHLSRAAAERVTGYVSVVGAGAVASAVQPVAFAPGETCTTVQVPLVGDDLPSAVGTAGYTVSVTNTTSAVMGSAAFGQLVVREDDGVIGAGTAVPPVGAQGDACAELAASRETGELATSASEVAPGGSVQLTATGFRVGESVQFTLGDEPLEPVLAGADGTAVATVEIAEDAELGAVTATATGAGSARVQSTTVSVLAPTAIEIELAEGGSLVEGAPLTFVATVEGAATDGVVSFVNAPVAAEPAMTARALAPAPGEVLGTAEVVDGVATFTLAEGLTAGAYSIVASFAATDVAFGSDSAPLAVTIAAAPVVADPGAGGVVGLPAATGAGESPAGGALAATGGEGFGWLLLAAVGLLGGGTLLAVRRRRTASVDS